MKKSIALAISTALLATSASTTALAGASANVGIASNYIWRGLTQTEDQAAVSGGLDYDFGNGFSVGTWASNVNFGTATTDDTGYELDLYGGYGGKMGSTDYSVGFIHYAYPAQDNIDFTEITAGLGFGPASLDLAYTVDADDPSLEDNLYIALSGSTDIKEGLSLGATIGHNEPDAGADYTHYQVSLSKGDFTFAVDDNDQSGSDPRVSVSWAHSIDL